MDTSTEQPPLEVLTGTMPPSPEFMACAGSSSGVALFNPCGLAVGMDGRVYIADTGHHRICMVEDGVLYVLAGTGARGCADGPGASAMFAHPCGLAISSEGYLFVADCGNHRIRQIAPDGSVSTLAGSGQPAHRDGHGRHACFYNPCGVAIDYLSNDVLYVADYSNNCVRAVSRSGLVSTLAKEADTPLDSPYGIAVHVEVLAAPACGTEATVYVSSYHSHSLARISPEGKVSILAGCGAPLHRDGYGSSAAFHAPNGLSIDADGVLYVADSGNHCIRRVSAQGEVGTIVRHGLNSPCGLCVCRLPGRGASLLIADRSNSCVRVLPIEASPPPLLAPSTMREDLRALLDGQSDSLQGEAVFEVEGRQLRAPKALLCARCPHFRAMFGSGMRESRGESVVVSETGYAVYRALLDYLLCDELAEGLSPESLLECMMLANAYGVLRLEQKCSRRLVERLNGHVVREVFRCAQLIGDSHLARACERFEHEQQRSPTAVDSPDSPKVPTIKSEGDVRPGTPMQLA